MVEGFEVGASGWGSLLVWTNLLQDNNNTTFYLGLYDIEGDIIFS